MTSPGLVIFDCDGVLVDSEPLACRVLADYLGELGVAMTADDCRRSFTGLSVASVKARVERDTGRALPEDFAAELRRRDRAVFEAKLQPVAGVSDAVAALPRGTRYCVASSGIPEKIRHSLGVTGLLELFTPHLFSAADVANGKPAPDLFLHAARRMGVAPAACVVVEDSVAGAMAAKAAGMRAVGFTGGGHADTRLADDLARAGADTVIARMADLADALDFS